MNTYIKDRREEGFTLIELLIAIVVVGILTAVVIVGIGGLTDTGEKGACQASKDATKAAVAVYYSNNNSTYPATIADMTGSTPPVLELGDSVTAAGGTVTGDGWSFTMTPGAGGAAPTYSACPA